MARLHQIIENRDDSYIADASMEQDQYSHEEDDSSDLNEMTFQVNNLGIVESSCSDNEQSISSSFFNTPEPKYNNDQPKQEKICSLNKDETDNIDESSKQGSAQADPMESPCIPQPVRLISIYNLREIANSDLSMVKDFVRNDVVLTKLKVKRSLTIEHLEFCKNLDTRPSNYRFNQMARTRRHRFRHNAGNHHNGAAIYLNARVSKTTARPSAFASKSQAMQSGSTGHWQNKEQTHNESAYFSNYYFPRR